MKWLLILSISVGTACVVAFGGILLAKGVWALGEASWTQGAAEGAAIFCTAFAVVAGLVAAVVSFIVVEEA